VNRFLVLFLCVGLLCVLTGCPQKEEATYQGKPTSEWMKLLKDKDPEVRKLAIVAVRAIGPEAKEAIPHLLEAFKDPELDVDIRTAAFSTAVDKLGLQQNTASDQLLFDVFKDSDEAERMRTAAGWMLQQRAEKALPIIIQGLKDTDAHTRRWSAELLGNLGPKAKGGVPALIEVIKLRGVSP